MLAVPGSGFAWKGLNVYAIPWVKISVKERVEGGKAGRNKCPCQGLLFKKKKKKRQLRVTLDGKITLCLKKFEFSRFYAYIN